jgi:hypothetical protein
MKKKKKSIDLLVDKQFHFLKKVKYTNTPSEILNKNPITLRRIFFLISLYVFYIIKEPNNVRLNSHSVPDRSESPQLAARSRILISNLKS